MAKTSIAFPTRVELALDDVAGSVIPNCQENELIPVGSVAGSTARYRKAYPDRVERTTFATAKYNCHGLVFAARRTQIDDPEVVARIIKNDGYTPIGVSEVLAGDVVIYVSERGAIDHSGIVVEPARPGDLLKLPKVMSKWGQWYEVVHLVHQCPYVVQFNCTYSFYRMTK